MLTSGFKSTNWEEVGVAGQPDPVSCEAETLQESQIESELTYMYAIKTSK